MKQKTNKAIAKRYKRTGAGKIMKRCNGQGHFNARENGKTGRNKKMDVVMSPAMRRVFRVAMPQ